jgi:geranylgeranyl diphosphate synthase, type I
MLTMMHTTANTEANPTTLDPAELFIAVDDALKQSLLRYTGPMPRTLIDMGKMALGAPGKVMFWRIATEQGEDAITPVWPLFVILSYRASLAPEERHTWRRALPAAVALEILAAATDLIDEWSDNDPSPIISKYGPGQALNTANLMLVMAQQVLAWAAQEGEGRAMQALGALQDMLVEAAVGQHLDMAYETMGPQEVTPEMSGAMTDKKAGALIGGACKIGALMAGADEQVVAQIERFGRNIGGIAQINNDMRDVLPQGEGQIVEGPYKPKTDLRQRKRTLPIVYALREEPDPPNPLQIAFSAPPSEDEDEDALRQAVVAAGGLSFAQLVLDLYKQNAVEALAQLERLRPGASTELSPLL